ncbi:uncharacterized protein BDW43DRAFT_223173 [Aspergillus alliaceus]|uniref:uncharacterized protein n=1 Tax=Petromyces alliaceus TaxID=209559 RepID=UPI0012A432E1|nr:uncharacterized protein BDW43DRAFT_223173 [Aspergillus alliaceus]KAB8236739.1 hypothetical protein BDW43DRAFT_223173 [Aspergillus alliaceus]
MMNESMSTPKITGLFPFQSRPSFSSPHPPNRSSYYILCYTVYIYVISPVDTFLSFFPFLWYFPSLPPFSLFPSSPATINVPLNYGPAHVLM